MWWCRRHGNPLLKIDSPKLTQNKGMKQWAHVYYWCFALLCKPSQYNLKNQNHSQFAVETRFFRYCVITLPCWTWYLTWIWSAIWQDASKGIGLQSTPLVVPNLREWLTEPSNSLNMYTYAYKEWTYYTMNFNFPSIIIYQDIKRICATQSRNSRGPCAATLAGTLYSHGRYRLTDLLSLPLPKI